MELHVRPSMHDVNLRGQVRTHDQQVSTLVDDRARVDQCARPRMAPIPARVDAVCNDPCARPRTTLAFQVSSRFLTALQHP